MFRHPAASRYNSLSIGLHWLTLLLLIAVYTCIELRVIYPKGSDPRELLKHWHFMLGLAVFAVVLLRVTWAWRFPVLPLAPVPPAWQRGLARVMHLLLYAFLLGMPLLGWITLSLKGKPVPFFGLELPALAAPDKAAGARLEEIHQTIGTLGYWLIGLHAAAALFHHYIVRDNSMRRMLPSRSVATSDGGP